jgi:hypothetical protein
MAADQRARDESTDPDARAARILAARLNFMAEEFETELADGSEHPPKKRDEHAEYIANRREFVRALIRTAERNDRDEWIALERLVGLIEIWAKVVGGRFADDSARRTLADFRALKGDKIAKKILAEFGAAHPREAKAVAADDVRRALNAACNSKKGSPKWTAFAPIGGKIVGESDPEAIKREINRLRSRKRRPRSSRPH